jgi:hypothetical protein
VLAKKDLNIGILREIVWSEKLPALVDAQRIGLPVFPSEIKHSSVEKGLCFGKRNIAV